MKKVTILLPAYNEQESIPLLYEAMVKVAQENLAYQWEFLLINDGSSDNTLQEIEKLHEKDNRFAYVDLSRNYGKEIAMMAGFDYIDGDAVIIMDSDLQHPTNVIPEMLKEWENGYKDVYAQRKSSNEGWFKKKTSKIYYRMLQRTTRIEIPKDTGDFRLLDRVCIDALKQMRETQRNTKGMYCWIGFKKKGISYEQLDRAAGTTKWNFFSLVALAIEGITSYTTAPLRIASVMGIFVSIIAFIYLFYIIVTTTFFGENVQGYPTIMVTILFIGGIQLIALGIIGEYLSRVFNEVKNRPAYFINHFQKGENPKN
ncbi:MAG: glycosyltransferase family 2 protein [Phocaeicola sp.]